MNENPTWTQVIKALIRLSFSKPVLIYMILMMTVGSLA